MTDQRSPLDTVLDLVFYAPLGLAVTVTEEVPKLAARGRSELGGRVAVARAVGGFAVGQVRSRIERSFARPAPSDAAAQRAQPAHQDQPRHPPQPAQPGQAARAVQSRPAPERGRPAGQGPGKTDTRPAEAPATRAVSGGEDGSAPSEQPAAVMAAAAPAPTFTSSVEDRPNPAQLAIPGYDSLSASQVVQRLAGLTRGELDAVRSYESATRGRRTILTRIGQLQGG